MTHRPMEWPKKGTLAQKVAAGRSAKAHLSIAQDAGAQARMRGVEIESNPHSTTNGPVEHRLAVGWFQSWIRYDKGLAPTERCNFPIGCFRCWLDKGHSGLCKPSNPPFCRTPKECGNRGTCLRDIACDH